MNWFSNYCCELCPFLLANKINPSLTAHFHRSSIQCIKIRPNFRMKGRFSGYGITAQNVAHFQNTLQRQISATMLERFGKDTTVDDLTLVLEAGPGVPFRRVDEKKRKQLTTLYADNLALLMIGDRTFKDIEITKISMPTFLYELRIHWRSSGDPEKDTQIDQVLKENEPTLRKGLSEALFSSRIPPMKFIIDKSHIELEAMNQLFATADYGIDYKGVSRTSHTLGIAQSVGKSADNQQQEDSIAENKENDEDKKKPKKTPRWVLMKERRKFEKLSAQTTSFSESNSFD